MDQKKPTGLKPTDEAICDLFSYIPDFLHGNVDNLTQEIQNILGSEDQCVTSCYIAEDTSILNFSCKPISDYKYISKLLLLVNDFNTGIPANSCVVNQYSAGQARANPHSDSESYVDCNAPIFTYSSVTDRDFFIYKKSPITGSPKINLIKTFKLKGNSLTMMQPPSQNLTVHQVQPGSGARWSISFRKPIPSKPNPHEWLYKYNMIGQTKPHSQTATPKSRPPMHIK